MTRTRAASALVFGLVATAITALATWPLAPNLFGLTRLTDSTVDDFIYYWNDWWVHRALFVRHQNPLFCDEIFHPNGHSLAATPLAMSMALLSLPFQAALGSLHGAAVTVKLLAFASFPAAVLSMRCLLLRLGVGAIAAFLGGCAYAFVPFRFLHLTRVHYLAGALTPWFLSLLLSSLREGGRRRIAACAVVFAFTAGCDASLLVEMGLSSAILLCFEARGSACLSRTLVRWIAVHLLAAIMLAPLVLPLFREVRANPGADLSHLLHFEYEPQRNQRILSPDLNSLAYYLSPSLHENLFAPETVLGRGAEPTRNILHSFRPPGDRPRLEMVAAAAAILWVGGFALAGLRQRGALPFATLAVLGFALALGPCREIGGETVAMPYAWLAEVIPGLNAGRYPAAHLRLFHLGIAVLSALSLSRSVPRWQLLSGALLVLLCTAWSQRTLRFEPIAHERIYLQIAADPSPGAVLDLPPRAEGARRKMALGQILHQRPLVNGPLTRVNPEEWRYFTEKLRVVPRCLRPPPPAFPDDPALLAEVSDNLDLLRRDRIRYLVIRRSLQLWDPTAFLWLEQYLRGHSGLTVSRVDGHLLVRVETW